MPDNWNPEFYQRHPILHPFCEIASQLGRDESKWPTLADYNALLNHYQPGLVSKGGATIRFVKQSEASLKFEEQYEPRIYLNGEVQTRLLNWHDFFQVLVWSLFPKTKSLLNSIQYNESTSNPLKPSASSTRSPLQNAVTLFDECGAIFLSDDQSLLDLVRSMEWKTLFWARRQDFIEHTRCFVFGHAMLEKAMNPYIGMTSHCILLLVSKDFFSLSFPEQLTITDTMLTNTAWPQVTSSAELYPIPLLGIPDWHLENRNEIFYRNTQYFRSSRRSHTASGS